MIVLTFEMSEGEIWFEPCRYDGTLEDARNPFTREAIKVPRNGTLTQAEQAAVEAVLDGSRVGGYTNMVSVSDGGIAEIDLAPSALMMKPRRARPTLGLATLAYDLLVAGSWCIRSDEAWVVSRVDNARDQPKDDARVPRDFYATMPTAVLLVESATAMASALRWGTE